MNQQYMHKMSYISMNSAVKKHNFSFKKNYLLHENLKIYYIFLNKNSNFLKFSYYVVDNILRMDGVNL